MPEKGASFVPSKQILSFEEITAVVRTAVAKGVTKVRLTGGEPLVRRGIVQLVEMIGSIPNIKDFGMTTNGLLLPRWAKPLKEGGLKRVNISMDTTNEERYRQISRGGELSQLLKGIDAALEAGLTPVKLNCVIQGSSQDEEAQGVRQFAQSKGLEVRFIQQMNLRDGFFSVVEGGEGGHCRTCSRLRLTATGMLKPCLFSDLAYDVRQLGVEEALRQALEKKPRAGQSAKNHRFYNMGG